MAEHKAETKTATTDAVDVKLASCKELLEATTVATLIAGAARSMVTIDSLEPPLAAFQKLIDGHIQSAPVHEAATGRWVGFLDIRDLVSYVILCYEFEEKKLTDEVKARERAEAHTDLPGTPAHGHASEFLRQVLSEEHSIERATMHRDPRKGITTKYLSVRNRFVPVHPEDTLYRAAQLLGNSEIHRVPVVDREGRLVDIISQSTIIKFLQRNAETVKTGLSATLSELGLAVKPLVTVLDTDTTLSAFRALNQRHITGLAIVNSSGVIVGNTSASDLKLFIARPSFRLLRMPVFQYLNIIRRASLHEGAPVVSVHAGDSLGKAIGKLSATGLHRIFVVDEANKPIGVVSLSDILKLASHIAKLPALPASPAITAHPAPTAATPPALHLEVTAPPPAAATAAPTATATAPAKTA